MSTRQRRLCVHVRSLFVYRAAQHTVQDVGIPQHLPTDRLEGRARVGTQTTRATLHHRSLAPFTEATDVGASARGFFAEWAAVGAVSERAGAEQPLVDASVDWFWWGSLWC